MKFALRSLDTGLFFSQGAWVSDPLFAQEFSDRESIEKAATEFDIKNVEAVFFEGEPPRVAGGFPIRFSK